MVWGWIGRWEEGEQSDFYSWDLQRVELRCCHTQSTSQRAFAATTPLRHHPRPPPPSADWLPFWPSSFHSQPFNQKPLMKSLIAGAEQSYRSREKIRWTIHEQGDGVPECRQRNYSRGSVLLPVLFRVMQLVAVVPATTMHSSYFPLSARLVGFYLFIFFSFSPGKRETVSCAMTCG